MGRRVEYAPNVDLLAIESALDLGRDARDKAFTCSVKPKFNKLALLGGAFGAAIGLAGTPRPAPAAVAEQARRSLAAYAEELARIAADLDDDVLRESAASGRRWADDLWSAEGRAREPVGRRIVEQVQPSLDRLVEIRTAMLLGRPFPNP
jgi:hypothetical protein